MTIFMHKTGPLVEYQSGGTLHIEDLNPHQIMRWQMGRFELVRFGCRCLMAAIFTR